MVQVTPKLCFNLFSTFSPAGGPSDPQAAASKTSRLPAGPGGQADPGRGQAAASAWRLGGRERSSRPPGYCGKAECRPGPVQEEEQSPAGG